MLDQDTIYNTNVGASIYWQSVDFDEWEDVKLPAILNTWYSHLSPKNKKQFQNNLYITAANLCVKFTEIMKSYPLDQRNSFFQDTSLSNYSYPLGFKSSTPIENLSLQIMVEMSHLSVPDKLYINNIVCGGENLCELYGLPSSIDDLVLDCTHPNKL